jgi:outer membrane protein assembly factor BamA
MPRYSSSLLMGALCLCAAFPAVAQTFQPKAIHFFEAVDYTDQDLISASGLQTGAVLSGPDVNARTQKLMDSGLFAGLTYKFDGTDLVFSVKMAQLFPIRLENIPLASGPDLDAQIRQRVPLYRGKVPGDGGVLNDVRAALEQILKAQGISATIETTPYGSLGQSAVSAISFTITSPKVLIGAIEADGGSLDPDALKVLTTLSGAAYDSHGSSAAIVQDTGEVYRSKGYLEAEVNASQLSSVSIASDAVRIPFRVSVTPGSLYKVASIQLAPDMIVSQADFDKQSQTKPGDPATAEHIAENWRFIERQYHNRGYERAKVKVVPTLDHQQATVSYAVSAPRDRFTTWASSPLKTSAMICARPS